MEKSRTIELLEHLAWDRDIEGNPYGEALQMAIDALKAQLSQEGTTFDMIDRQAALDIFDDYNVSVENGELEAYSRDRKRMCELPPAQPERKRGKWLADNRPGGGFWVCSCCKFPSEAFAANVLYKFCPNCGADMRGEKDG